MSRRDQAAGWSPRAAAPGGGGSPVTLSAGSDRVVVDPRAGGRLASLVAGGVERLVGPDAEAEGERPDLGWGCFLMAPWVGRLDSGRLPFAGTEHRLQPDYEGHAIHGVVSGLRWDVDAADDTTVELSCALPPDRWPFGGRMRQRVALAPGRLALSAELAAGSQPMPASLGWHPWFRRPALGELRVGVGADEVLALRPDLVPTGDREPVTAEKDLRDAPELGTRRLDDVYVDPGSAATVAWPDLVLTIGLERPLCALVVHTPARGVCVEPMTAWPDAPSLHERGVAGTGLVTLEPGQRLAATTTWSWHEGGSTRVAA